MARMAAMQSERPVGGRASSFQPQLCDLASMAPTDALQGRHARIISSTFFWPQLLYCILPSLSGTSLYTDTDFTKHIEGVSAHQVI